MRRPSTPLACAVLVSAVLLAPPAPAQPGPPSPATASPSAHVAPAGARSAAAALPGWLAGCWELRTATRVTVEMWMPPAAGTMLGASRTVVRDAVREFEFLRLVAQGDSLTYVAQPGGRPPTRFPATQASDSLLVFENPAHDFPQRILYRRRGADSLVARVEGPQGGQVRGIDFPMRRVSCEAVP